MAGLTKEQRAQRLLEKEQLLREKIEKEVREEYETITNEKLKETAKKIQTDFKKIPLDTVIPVISNVKGGLHYDSKRTNGYSIDWDDYGGVEYLELSELVSMRNTSRRFFEDNWIVISNTDEYTANEIYKFLKVDKYYKNYFTPNTIDTIFDMPADDIIKTVSTLSDGMKMTIASKAKELIDNKILDSNNKIEALEMSLGMKFNI